MQNNTHKINLITHQQTVATATQSALKKIAKLALKHLQFEEFSLNIIFETADKIKQLNKQYRQQDKTTDVLSFSYLPEHQGEIFIYLQQAEQQAQQAGITLQQEVLKLTVHGIVHIAGYDHQTDTEYKTMQQIENNILEIYELQDKKKIK